MSYIFKRDDKYLSERYEWGNTPNAFPEWQFGQVLEEAMQYRDHPQYVGEMVNGDLDQVVWKKLG